MQKPAIIFIVVLIVSGCASVPDRPREEFFAPGVATMPDGTMGKVVFTAVQLIGVPYRWGGASPEQGVDCSGLVHYSYRNAGVPVPRTSRELFRAARRIQPENLKPGDLVFFRLDTQWVSHVGIYLGNDRFIHAPRTGKNVGYASLGNDYWRERFAGAGTFF